MDINALIQTLQSIAPQMAESYCIINGALMSLDEVRNMGYDEFNLLVKGNMPLKLYKYFPNREISLIDEKTGQKKTVNYSIQALRDDTVFMQSPSLFDDVYDSDISLNYDDYERARLLEYCKRCDINVSKTMPTKKLRSVLLQAIGESFNSNGNFDFILKCKPDCSGRV